MIWSGQEIARVWCTARGKHIDIDVLYRDCLDEERRANALNAGLDAALAFQGLVVLHSSAFVLRGKHVLVVGPSLSGKSTLAAAALRAGGEAIADDAVILRFAPPDSSSGRVTATGLSSAIWLRERSAKAFAIAHAAPTSRGDEPRWRLEVGRVGRVAAWAEVDAVWFPTIHTGRAVSSSGRVPSSMAMARLLQSCSALLTDPALLQARPSVVGILATLVNTTPAYEAALGIDLLESPDAVLCRLLPSACDRKPVPIEEERTG